jgi:methionine synthase I (cobalamin-dependent)/5,10-methylenetetrahydrofolate reductase
MSQRLLFRERLQQNIPLVTDGSIAAELAERGHFESPAALYNLKNPVLVETIHRDFLQTGIELIQTNTEHANRIALERWNLADKVYEINRKGVWIARCAALHKGYVAAVVDPVGKFLAPLGHITPDEIRQAFIEQIIALADGGADVLMLKSFIDVHELEIAIDAAKYVAPNLPIIAQKTFPEDGAVLSTTYPAEISDRLIKSGADVIGSNSTVGPQRMLDIIKSLPQTDVPLCAQPDVGIPTIIDGKSVFNADADYVARSVKRLVEAGVMIVGADGGATVKHIRAIVNAVKTAVIGSAKTEPKKIKVHEPEPPRDDERSQFHKLLGTKFLATVELDIPRGLDMSSVIEGARYCKEHGIDAVNISDGARARLRMNSIAISKMVQDQVGIDCLAHLACRDRNMIGLQSEIIGGYAMGVRNILAVTGDPTQIGDYPYATSVYDVDAIGLIRAMGQMNSGRDLMGNPIGRPTSFLIACAANPCAFDLDREVRRMEQKASQGAHIAFSQPVFEIKTLETFLNRIHHLNIKFMLGVIPLRTPRHADFLHYEVPGMDVPEWVRKRMHATQSTEEASREGITMAVDFLRQAKTMVDGVYLMPPFKKYSMAVEILEQL